MTTDGPDSHSSVFLVLSKMQCHEGRSTFAAYLLHDPPPDRVHGAEGGPLARDLFHDLLAAEDGLQVQPLALALEPVGINEKISENESFLVRKKKYRKRRRVRSEEKNDYTAFGHDKSKHQSSVAIYSPLVDDVLQPPQLALPGDQPVLERLGKGTRGHGLRRRNGCVIV
jgi:hypothetical protein